MRSPIYSFDTSELVLNGLRNRARQGDRSAKMLLINRSHQYRRDLRAGRKECPFSIA